MKGLSLNNRAKRCGSSCRRFLALVFSLLTFSMLTLLSGCGESGNPDGLLVDGPNVSKLLLTDLEGASVRLDAYAGKTLVVNFWATWCAPCREEMPALQSLSEQLDPQHYAVLGVSVDSSVARVKPFLQEQGVDFKQFIDAKMEVAMSDLKIRAFPETLIISPEGQIIRRILGARAWDDKNYYQSVLSR